MKREVLGGRGGRETGTGEAAGLAEVICPLQAEALGSAKAMQVTQLGLRLTTSISKQSRSPKERNHARAKGEGGRVYSLCCTRHTPCGLSPARGKHVTKGVFVTW